MGEITQVLRIPQPAVSKHLGVLRKVGIVSVTKQGQLRLYRLEPKELKPLHDWVKKYERFWTQHFESIRERAERKAAERLAQTNPHTKDKEK